MALTTTIKGLQDLMRQDVGVDGDAQRISQLVWLLFLKIFDDQEREREAFSSDYRSPIPAKLRWRNWAADREGLTGEELLHLVNLELFPKLKALAARGSQRNRALVIRTVFEDAFNYMKSGTLLRQVINKIEEDLDFNDSEKRHALSQVYEKILRDLQSAGNAGEFYTPRPVVDFMVDRVNPRLGETVLDPACGTGGFLVSVLEHVRRNEVTTAEQEKILQSSLEGIEKKPLPHLLCMTNLILHNVDAPLWAERKNALTHPYRDYQKADQVDVVLTNPPFGGVEEEGVERNFPSQYQTRETADLFLALILKRLKPKGRVGLVLPDGFLFGEGVKTELKKKLLTECNLHTIVRLPKGVFAPYTSINTNLLFFEQGTATEEVWFYEHPYPPGYKSYSKTKPLRLEEFEAEKVWWSDRQETEHAWRVPVSKIVERGYNLEFKNPNTPDDGPGDPEELLERYLEASRAAEEAREALKFALAEALER